MRKRANKLTQWVGFFLSACYTLPEYPEYRTRFLYAPDPDEIEGVGFIKAHQNYLEVVHECKELEPAKQKEKTIFAIARQLSRRFAFGY